MLGSRSYEEVERLLAQLCGNHTPQAVREPLRPRWRTTTCCEAMGTTSASQISKEVSRWGADAGKVCQSLKPWQHRVPSEVYRQVRGAARQAHVHSLQSKASCSGRGEHTEVRLLQRRSV